MGALVEGCGLGGWVGTDDGFAVGRGVSGGLGVGLAVGVSVESSWVGASVRAREGEAEDWTKLDESEVEGAFVVEGKKEGVAVEVVSLGLIDADGLSNTARAVGVGFAEGIMRLESIDGTGVSSVVSAVGVGFDEGEVVRVGRVVGRRVSGVLGLMVDDSGTPVWLS